MYILSSIACINLRVVETARVARQQQQGLEPEPELEIELELSPEQEGWAQQGLAEHSEASGEL